jgi:aspartokinase
MWPAAAATVHHTHQVPEAVCLPSMTYHEAWELSYFGANVLHPRTTLPAMKYGIPIAIRNFFKLASPGKQTDLREHEVSATNMSVRLWRFA